jgi:hypothetical protein
MLESKLHHHGHSDKNRLMSARMVMEDPTQTIPLLESLVDCLMSCTDPLGQTIIVILWCFDVIRLASVPKISFGFLSRIQLVFQSSTKDANVWPLATWKRATDPNHITTSNTNCDFIPKTRSIELEAKPPFPERSPFKNPKVCGIHGNQALIAGIIAKAVLPNNLEWRQNARASLI